MMFTEYPGLLLNTVTGSWPAPNVRSSGGTITTLVVNRAHLSRIGQIQWLHLDVSITTNGTGSGRVMATLPTTLASDNRPILFGREVSASGISLVARLSSSEIDITTHTGTYPGASGRRLVISGFYEV